MKKIILSISSIFCLAFSLSAQNGIIVLTEEFTNAPPYTSMVHVTLANNTVTSTVIPSEQLNVATHDQGLNAIINGITSLGYKIIQAPEGWGYFGLSSGGRGVRRLFFAQPWTASSSELGEATTSQIFTKIYPNPTIGPLNLEVSYKEGYEPTKIVVINIAGYIVFSEDIKINTNNIVKLDLSHLKSGVYVLSVLNKSHYSTPAKLIIQ